MEDQQQNQDELLPRDSANDLSSGSLAVSADEDAEEEDEIATDDEAEDAM